MKDVDKTLQEMEQVTEEVQIALKALLDGTDAETVTNLIVGINDVLNNASISNAVSALSFILGMVLSNNEVLTEHERNITLYAFYMSTKAAIRTIEEDD